VDGATQSEASIVRPRDDAAPVWLLILVLVLLVTVVGVSWLVGRRIVDRRAEAALSADPRVEVLENAVSERPEDLGSRRQLAQVYLQLGRDKDALREYKRVLSESPDDAAALYSAGVLYLSSGENKAGEESLLRVIELDPTHSYAALALAEHYSATQRVEKVVAVVKPAADAHPEIADLQYLAGLGYEETGAKESAVKYYRRALRFVPDMKEALEALDRLGAER